MVFSVKSPHAYVNDRHEFVGVEYLSNDNKLLRFPFETLWTPRHFKAISVQWLVGSHRHREFERWTTIKHYQFLLSHLSSRL